MACSRTLKNRPRRRTPIESQAPRRQLPNGGVVDINRFIGFLLLALAFYFIMTQPHEAAAVAQSVGYTLRAAADSIFTFFSEIL